MTKEWFMSLPAYIRIPEGIGYSVPDTDVKNNTVKMHEIGSEGDISHSSVFSKMLHELKMDKLQISESIHLTEHNVFLYRFL